MSGGADNADYHLGGERLGSGLVALCCKPFSAMTGFDRFSGPITRGNPRFVPIDAVVGEARAAVPLTA
jgi:hypothetical protein